MSIIYITGHRNPDLDSVCSAYGYAALKNILDPSNEYIPVRCGHLSESSTNILKALDITPPELMLSVFPKVSDVMLTSDEKIDIDEPLTVLAMSYEDTNPSVVPIYEKGEFYGLISIDDITYWFMKHLCDNNSDNYVPTIREVIRDQEKPLETIDLFEEAKSALSSSPKRGIAVMENGEYKGYVTRRCFLRAPSYNVILVDHNEPRQSIKGIETANIVEIVDHHRLDSLKTSLPIFIDAEPLGSTCTIVYQLYLRNKLTPSKDVAKVLLTGMMADTLVLKSPTTTAIDVASAHALAAILGVEVKEFGHNMFSYMERLSNIQPQTAILSDFKRYTEKGINIGIGQCETTTLHDLNEYIDSFLEALEDVRAKNGLDWAVVMITNVLSENSILLTTDYRSVKHLPYSSIKPLVLDMPGVMSRKKQLLPEIIYSLGM
ncbi:MAG: DHH family phosphoesterase [Lachnospiraceae bacterium]|nr:DHH family phosphoesterase [Lachnospiraceae bacterium]